MGAARQETLDEGRTHHPLPDAEKPQAPRCNRLCDHERLVLRQLRAACSEATGLPVDYPFFRDSHRPGEHPDDALLRLFREQQGWTAGYDEQVIARMTRRR